jgi:hypothetical protein
MIRSFFSEQINFARSGGLHLRPTDPVSLFGGVTFALFLALLLSCATRVSAQVSTGTIVGTVQDSQGLPVEGATVTLTNQGTNHDYTSVSSSEGAYQFESIDNGLYRVSVSKAGFKNGVVQNIKLDTSTKYSVAPIQLELGATTESIVVEAGAETIQSSNAEVTGTVEKKQIDELPILDRNPLNLLSLQVGVANSGPGGQAETTINGQRSSTSVMTLDGINIQDNFIRENALDFSPNLPFLSQAQEFTITEQNGDVDKGGSSGVSIVTPNGTNDWHGEGFWYYRTNAWAANDWFNAASGTPIAGLLQNQGGGNIGGPVKKDKLFIYGYYELLRLKKQSPNNTTVLSPAIQTALASGTLPFTYQPVDMNTGAPVGPPVTQNLLTLPNHTNPPYTVDPATLKIIQRVPTTSNNNRFGDGVNLLGYQFNARNNNSRDNYGFRTDFDLNSKNTFSGIWSYNRNFVDRPDIDTSFNKIPVVFNDDHVKFLSTSWRWSPSSNFTNQARFGFNLAPAFFLTAQKFGSAIVDSLGFPFTGPDPNFQGQGRNTHTWVGQDNASLVRGNHVIKFGAQYQRVTIHETNDAGILPDLQIGFSQVNTNAPAQSDFPAPSNAQISSSDFGNATALLASAAGILSNVTQTFNVATQKSGYVPLAPSVHNLRQNNLSLYVGDNWKISPKLTFNYGVRWEYFGPVDEKNGLALLPVIPKGSTVAQTLLTDATFDFAGGPSKRPVYNRNFKQFAPNLGIAWDPFGNGKTAVRAGFGIAYVNDSFFTAVENAFTGIPGLSTTNQAAQFGLNGPTVSSAPAVTVPQFQIPSTFSANANALGVPSNVGFGIDPNLKAPYVEQWNLAIQRNVGANTSFTVGYVGNHSVGLFRGVDLNQVIINSNGFLPDFNRARANGFLALATPANAPGCGGQGTQTQCGQFNPLFNPNLAGSQPLTIFPNLCPAFGGNGLIGPPDAGGFAAFNSEILKGTVGDLAHQYQQFGCATTSGFFAPSDLILGADYLKNASFSTYHGGFVEVRRRLSNGLYFQANYTYSKVMTDYGTSVNGDQSRFQPYQDNARPQLEKARAPFDFNHQFKANFTYELPIGKGHSFSPKNRFAELLLSGWQTGSIFTWQSGAPFSILSTRGTFNRDGSRSARNTAFSTLTHQQISSDLGVFVRPGGIVYIIDPKLVSPNGTGAPASEQLTCMPAVPGGFCNPQPGQVGNLQLYAFTAPTYFDWDLSAAKNFHITERVRLTFRTEAFNVLNHPVFAPPFDTNGNAVLNINDRQFGQSKSTVSSPRILQMSLRLKF